MVFIFPVFTRIITNCRGWQRACFDHSEHCTHCMSQARWFL